MGVGETGEGGDYERDMGVGETGEGKMMRGRWE